MNTQWLYLLTLACRFVRTLCHQRLPSNKHGSRLLVPQSSRSDHVFFNSASVSRLQAFPRHFLFLLTCEFRERAWRVVLNVGFLRVCPIQPQFSLICMSIGSCHALFPKFFISDPFRPSDVEQAPETYIVKCLDLLESRFAHSLYL